MPVTEHLYDIEDYLETEVWAQRNSLPPVALPDCEVPMAEGWNSDNKGWNPDAVAPPLGDVYRRYAEPEYSSLWLISGALLLCAAMAIADRFLAL